MHFSTNVLALFIALGGFSYVLAAPLSVGANLSVHRHQGENSVVYKREPGKKTKAAARVGAGAAVIGAPLAADVAMQHTRRALLEEHEKEVTLGKREPGNKTNVGEGQKIGGVESKVMLKQTPVA